MIIVVDNTQDAPTIMYLPKLISMLKSYKCDFTIVKTYEELLSVIIEYKGDIEGVLLSGSHLMIHALSNDLYRNVFVMNAIAVFLCGMRLKIPVIGICFGCQFIHTIFGGGLLKLQNTICLDCKVYDNDSERTSYRYKARFCCSYILSPKTAPVFLVQQYMKDIDCLKSEKDRTMHIPCIIKHSKYPIYGVMYHPEFHKHTHSVVMDILQPHGV